MGEINVQDEASKRYGNTESKNKKDFTQTLNVVLCLLVAILNISSFPTILTMDGKVLLTYGMEIILVVSCLSNGDTERINEDLGATLIVAIEMHR